MGFVKASKKQARLRLALVGPPGAGKTYTALSIASHLGRVAVIDTERGSASKYANRPFAFDVQELESGHPKQYIDAINEASKAGYDVLIIDSLSHAWNGKDGALELVDNAARRSKSGSSFNAWREVTPLQQTLIDTILRCPAHVIVTMRSKMEYVLERDEKTGKQTPRKVGLAPVQRDGVEYEFDVVGDIDIDNTLTVTKTRCADLTGKVIAKPGKELAETLVAWLSDGEPMPPPKEEPKSEKNPFAEEAPDFRAKILEASKLEDLEALIPEIKKLSDKERKALMAPFTAKKKELASNGATHA